jgi:hypothetical protein
LEICKSPHEIRPPRPPQFVILHLDAQMTSAQSRLRIYLLLWLLGLSKAQTDNDLAKFGDVIPVLGQVSLPIPLLWANHLHQVL